MGCKWSQVQILSPRPSKALEFLAKAEDSRAFVFCASGRTRTAVRATGTVLAPSSSSAVPRPVAPSAGRLWSSRRQVMVLAQFLCGESLMEPRGDSWIRMRNIEATRTTGWSIRQRTSAVLGVHPSKCPATPRTLATAALPSMPVHRGALEPLLQFFTASLRHAGFGLCLSGILRELRPRFRGDAQATE